MIYLNSPFNLWCILGSLQISTNRGSSTSEGSSLAGVTQNNNSSGNNKTFTCGNQNSPDHKQNEVVTTGEVCTANREAVSCINLETNENEMDWRNSHSIIALRRRASGASQQYSPQSSPQTNSSHFSHDLDYSSVY